MYIFMSEIRPLTTEECHALEQAYINCEEVLKRQIDRLLDNKSLCDDCVQETLLWAMKYIDSFMASNNKEGWLVRAGTNVTMKIIQKERRQSHDAIQLDKVINVLRYSITTTDPKGRADVIAEIKKHLSKKNGEFFELVMTTNKSHGELAKMLNKSESAVRSKWKRMIDEIRELPDEIKNKLEFL